LVLLINDGLRSVPWEVHSLPLPSFLRQYRDLRPEDFERHPVWVDVHGTDQDEPWYNDDAVSEETFRPFDGPLPADPNKGILLVPATLRLADGTECPGFCTPRNSGLTAFTVDDLGDTQPILFTGDETIAISFWFGMIDPRPSIQDSYRSLKRTKDAIFPIVCTAKDGLCLGPTLGEIPGFCWEPFVQKGQERRIRMEH